jgi:DNA polymerase III gamma/tau subunit
MCSDGSATLYPMMSVAELVERIEKAENVSYSEDVVAWVWKKNKGVVRNILNDLQSVVEFANDLKKVKKYLKKVRYS